MDEPNKATAVEEAAIGPGTAIQGQVDPPSLLEGVEEYDYVEVLNPLSVTFIARTALTTDIKAPMRVSPNNEAAPGLTKSEADIRQVYGFDLRAQAQKAGKTHIITDIPIASGQTLNLMGREAKVVVQQLVTAYLQREGKQHLVANKFERLQVEQRIVQRTGQMRDILGKSPLSIQEQMNTALKHMNDEPVAPAAEGGDSGQVEFPGLNQPDRVGANPSQSDQSQPASDTSGKRNPGRPKAQGSA